MKLPNVFCKRNLMLIYLIMSILFSLTMVSMPVKAPEEVRVYVKMPDGYIPGVASGGTFDVDIYIESPAGWENTSNGIVGWSLYARVDPAVLTPWDFAGATPGYFLRDFVDTYASPLNRPKMLIAGMNSSHFMDLAEYITGWETLGVGAGGNGTLCTLTFKSKSATAYSLIDLYNVYYYTPAGMFSPDIVVDGHYNPPPVYHNLTVESTPFDGINFTIDGDTYTTNATVELEEGSYNVTMPSTWMNNTDQYNFVEWEDYTTDPFRTISLTSDTTITATYKLYVAPVYHNLTVESTPIDGINFTIDMAPYTTNATVELEEETYTVTMPSTWTNGTDQYKFVEWEDNSTDRARTISLTSDTTIIATYRLMEEYALTVDSYPIAGINFTIDGITHPTNWTGLLLEGDHLVVMPSTWTTPGDDMYYFDHWEDASTSPSRLVSLTSNMTITATYVPPVYTLTVESTPFDGINFTIDTTSHTTNATVGLPEGSYNVTMPSTWMNNTDQYNFVEWEDHTTDPFRTISLTSNTTIVATYELYVPRVRVYVKMPDGYIPGVPAGETFVVEVWIESPPEWTNTSDGIVGWSIYAHVDPAVLTPWDYAGNTPGFWLRDFVDTYAAPANRPFFLLGGMNSSDFEDLAEYIAGWETLGVGAGGSGHLCNLTFKSKSATDYTLIDLFNVYYYTSAGMFPADIVDDGHYNEVPVHLTVESTPIDGINFTIDLATRTTNTTVELGEGTYTVTMPSTWMDGTDQYYFRHWEDNSTNPVRTISLSTDKTIIATYSPPKEYALMINSSPITGINFTIDGITHPTNWTDLLLEEDHSVEMPSTWTTAGGDVYKFDHWQDDSEYRIRTISLTSNMTFTAFYIPVYNLTVESTPFDGINFKIDTTFYMTNTTVPLEEGLYTVTLLDTSKTVNFIKYYFKRWEDNSTNPIRTISLTSDMTITAIYEPPKKYALTVNSSPIAGINFKVDVVTTRTTNWTGLLLEGSHSVEMPSTWITAGGDVYKFDHWQDDSTNRIRTIPLTSNKTVTAIYALVYHTLTVKSTPIAGIDFTIDSTTYTTNTTVALQQGTYTVTMPSTWMVGTDQYNFVEWEDTSTDPTRTIPLTTDTTVTAYYALVPPPQWTLHVNSDPITGISFTLDGVTYATNWSNVLTEGTYTVVMPSTWTTGEGKVYNFIQWEDASTNPSRVTSLTSNMTITATYERKLVPPVASFTFSPTKPTVGETVTFDASASSDSDGTIVSYAWDFGDGASGSGAIVEHAYTAAGTYDVTLTVTDNDGLTHTITKSITVEETPPPGIPWYLYVAAAGAAAIIIAAIAFYFLRIKKPKPT